MSYSRIRTFRSIALLAVIQASRAPWGLQANEKDEASAEYADEQRDIKKLLLDVGTRMQRLARKIEASQPDDAKRMRDAADRIHNSNLSGSLEDISALLGSASFLEALGRQDRALEELDAIIRLLEKAKFETGDLEKKVKELEEIRRAAEKASSEQEKLLRKTQEHLDWKRALEALKAVKDEVSGLKEKQAGLEKGTDPEKLDPGASEADLKDLEKALDLAKELKAAQDKLNGNMASLPKESLPIDQARELVSQLDQLLEKAQDLRDGTEATRAGADMAKAARAEAQRGKEGGVDRKDRINTGEGKEAKEGKEGEEAKKGNEVKGQEGKEGKEAKEGKTEGKDGEAGKEGKNGESGKEGKSGEEGKDGRAGTDSKDTKDTRDGAPRSGASDVEAARRDAAVKEAQGHLAKASKGLEEDIRKLAGTLSKESPGGEDAKKGVDRAAEDSKGASRGLEKGDFDAALDAAKKTAQDLKAAREAAAKSLAALEEKNAGETAGIAQEQGMLEKRTSEGANELGQKSGKSSSESARSAMEKGSESLSQASKAMEEAARATQGGSRDKAREAGARASAEIAKAQTALEKGKQVAAARSEAEKAQDLQKKLAKKAEETQKQIEELQKKLKKKGEEGPQKLGSARDALAGASKSMQDAAQAGAKGDSSLQKKKQGEAAEQLSAAQESLEEEEKDQLARLDREKLDKEKQEQDELARLTKALAQKAKGSQGAADQSESLEGAAQDMDEASQELEKKDAEAAEKEQQEALAKLRGAQDELRKKEEELAQLKREREMLSMVDALGGVKETQEKINAEVAKLDQGRDGRESRSQRLKLQQKSAGLVKDQDALAEQVDSLNGKLKAEFARVFTFVLRNVSADMRQVRDLVKEIETGPYTQFLGKEILHDLDRLIATLKEQIEAQKQDGDQKPSKPQEGGRKRLVPPVAELRMLREMQTDVNRSTRDLEDVRKASADGVTESWQKALDRLIQKQSSVGRMTLEIKKDFDAAKAAEAGEGEGGGEGEDREKDKKDGGGNDH